MAKKFMGFKPETMTNKILPALGYSGPSDQKSINAFLAASPAAAAKMGKYTMAARQMVEGKVVNAARGMTVGKAGNIVSNIVNQAKTPRTVHAHGKDLFGRDISSSSGGGGGRSRQQASPVINPNQPNPVTVNPDGSTVTPLPGGGTSTTYSGPTGAQMPSGSLLSKQIGEDPTKMVTRAGVVAADGGPNTLLKQGTGQAVQQRKQELQQQQGCNSRRNCCYDTSAVSSI